VSILFRNASLRERSDDTAGSCSCGSANRGRGQPTSCHNGTEAGDRQQAEPGKNAGSATYARANAGAFASTLGAIVDTIAVAIHLLVGVEPAVRLAGALLAPRANWEGFALACALGASLFEIWLKWLDQNASSLIAYPAVAFTALLGGIRPAALVAVIGGMTAW
jgi:hypothetical protein